MSDNPWTAASRARVLELYGRPDTTGSSIARVLADEFGMMVSKSAVIGVTSRGTPRPPRVIQTPEETLLRSGDPKRQARAAAREGRPAPAWAFPGANRPAQRPASAPKRTSAPKTRAVPVAKPVAVVPRPDPQLRRVIPSVPPSLLIPLTSAPIGVHRIIADDPKAGPALVCGHPVAPGSSWCPGHRRICTVPQQARVSSWLPRRAA